MLVPRCSLIGGIGASTHPLYSREESQVKNIQMDCTLISLALPISDAIFLKHLVHGYILGNDQINRPHDSWNKREKHTHHG